MNRVETVRLHPPDPAPVLAWLEQFNTAANWLSGVAFRERLWHWLPLQRRAYREVRERFQLPAAATVVVIRKVASAYRHTQRRQHQAAFRRRGAIPVYKHQYKRDGTVSLYGIRIPFTARPQAELSSRHQGGAVLSAGEGHHASSGGGGRPRSRPRKGISGLRPGDGEPAHGQRGGDLQRSGGVFFSMVRRPP